jgi:3-phosphoshikimate 1-carboxyvinyltransferase
MTDLRIYPQVTPLRGSITVPGDKSISHRAVLFAALADGVSVIRNWLPSGDTLATLDAVRALGIQVETDEYSSVAWDLRVTGRGLSGLRPPRADINCRHAGTGMRLLAGVLAGQRFASVLDGSEQLRRRPMRRIIEPLRQMGADITAEQDRAPLRIRPARLYGIQYRMPMASAQVKSAILLAGLYAVGATAVFQPGPARDHTERMLSAMGVDLTTACEWITLGAKDRPRRLKPLDLTVPGDISSAAFPLVAAAVTPHSRITILGVGVNETRTGLLAMLEAMGAQVRQSNQRLSGGEPVADLTVEFAELHGVSINGDVVVRGIDEFPVWAVAGTQAAGESSVSGAGELRVKEVDRIQVLAGELRRFGLQVEETPDGFVVNGPRRLGGATVESHDDHRLAMSLAVAGLVADGETVVRDAGCARDSFPEFAETMCALGAHMEWLD